MNEPYTESGAVPVAAAASPAPYKDRSAGLIVFGVLTILLGCLAGLFVLLMLLGQMMGSAVQQPEAQPPVAALLPAVAIYGGLAVALVWLGIGSIMARRWARALLLIFSWCWLVIGLLAMLFLAFFIPTLMKNMAAGGRPGQPEMPPGAVGVMLVFMFLIWGVLFVVLPAVWTFFYRSRHVKATCETRDPVAGWTDACPLPVLGLCLLLAVSVPTFLLMPVAMHGVMPFFGMFLSGLPGSLLCLALAGVWGYAAWSLYRLQERGWWLILIALLVFLLSSLLTYARHDPMEMYALMGWSPAQLEQLNQFNQTGLLTSGHMVWLMVISMTPFLIYLLWIKKYFRRSN
jgi:hypothetical protein